MQKIRNMVAVILAFLGRKSVTRAATALTTSAVLVGAGSVPSYATTTDPLNGAGTDLVGSLLENFTTYVIPAVGGVILAVYAFKMIVKLGTRFLNRA